MTPLKTLATPHRPMSPLRKIIAALVGLAFVTVLASTVTSMTSAPEVSDPAAPTDAKLRVSAPPAPTPAPATPDPAPVNANADRIIAAWSQWVAETGLDASAMAVVLPDGTRITQGIGRNATQPVPVASLSKLITGLCLDDILREQGRGWDTTLGAIGAEMSAAGVTPRGRAETLTLAALVSHRAGLAPDLTQGEMATRLHGALGLHRRIAWQALAPDAIQGAPDTFFYANTNYAVLGVVIEALTGAPYTEVCQARVLDLAGITDAVGQGRMGSMSSYAGWEISAADYAALLHHWFASGPPPHAPGAPTGGYRLGYIRDALPGGDAFTHTGRLCADSRVTHNLGAIFVTRPGGGSFVANWDDCLDMAAYDRLLTTVEPFLR